MKHETNDMIYIPNELEDAVLKGIQNGKRIRRKKRHRAVLTAFGSAAAVFVLLITVCISNPTMAERVPFIGKIFAEVEAEFSYPGDYSERSTHLANTIPDKEISTQELAEDETASDTFQQLEVLYGDTNQNITIIPEEVYCDGTSLYLGLRMVNADEGGWGFESASHCIEGDGVSEQIELSGSISFAETKWEFHQYIKGQSVDSSAFIGMLKIPIEGADLDVTESKIHIDTIFWTHYMNYLKTEESTDGTFYPYHILKDGGWNLTVPVSIDTSQSQTYEINDVDEQGYGIDFICITPYEIQVGCIRPYEHTDENGFYGGFAVFNENGEYFQYQERWKGTEGFSVDGKSTGHLYFYFFEDEFEAVKCRDQSEAENKCIYKYELLR